MKEKLIVLVRFEFHNESTDDGISLCFKMQQLSIRPAFNMTINKCQREILRKWPFLLISPILLTVSYMSCFLACQIFNLFTFI